MAMTIGRVGIDIALPEPESWSEGADGRVSLQGWLTASTSADASFLREQILGLADPFGEPFVPVTLGHDDERDGWYQVLDVDVEHVLGQTEIDGGRRWSCTLRRLPYRTQPRYELHRYGTVWTNSHSITEGVYVTGFVGLPATSVAVDLGATGYTRTLRSSDTGEVAIYDGVQSYDHVVSAYVPIADAYDGAAKIEVDVDGSQTWRTVVGTDIRALPTRWRLGNGMIRTTWDTTNHGFAVEVYDTGSWEELGTVTTSNYFLISDESASFITTDPVEVGVLRNDPLACTLRLVFDYESALSRMFCDVTVRRGDRNVFGIIKTRSANQWGLSPTVQSTTTSTTGGTFRVDQHDDAGNRWVMSSPKTASFNTSTGAWRVSSSTSVIPWAIGVEIDGSSATGSNVATQVSYQYFSQPTESLFIAKN